MQFFKFIPMFFMLYITSSSLLLCFSCPMVFSIFKSISILSYSIYPPYLPHLILCLPSLHNLSLSFLLSCDTLSHSFFQPLRLASSSSSNTIAGSLYRLSSIVSWLLLDEFEPHYFLINTSITGGFGLRVHVILGLRFYVILGLSLCNKLWLRLCVKLGLRLGARLGLGLLILVITLLLRLVIFCSSSSSPFWPSGCSGCSSNIWPLASIGCLAN